jgi:dTDP-L-rhamnose 4-epimerase
MRALVTGGAGFIGSHLVDALIAGGHEVRILDNLEPQVHGAGATWPVALHPAAERLQGDVCNPDAVARALAGIEIVFHQAAVVGVGQSMYELSRYVRANALGAAVLLEAIAEGRHRVERLIVASSMSIYGEGAYRDGAGRELAPEARSERQLAARDWELRDEEGQPLAPCPTAESKALRPTSVYAITKRDQEELFLSVGRSRGIPTVALRYFNAYGPRQALSNPYTGVLAIFGARLLNGQPPLLHEDGRQSRDFVHVSDLVQANLLAMTCPAAEGRVYNVGTGRPTTVLAVARLVASALGVEIEPRVEGSFRAGDIRHCYADLTRSRRELGFEPRVDLADGIHQTVQWLRGQTAVDRVVEAQAELLRRSLIR